MKKQRRILALVLAIILALSFLVPLVAHAAENEGYGNRWVYDEAQVISAETEAYIQTLNEEVFANYANKPQLAFIILKDLPYNMDSYKMDMFNEYGVGTATENHGMLFVFAINDREYGLEIGDGFVKGSILRQDLEADFITDSMKNSLREGDYDTVVYQVAEHLANLMADEENLVYAQKEEAAAAKRAEEQAEAEARHAQFEKAIPWILGGFLAIVAIGSVGYVVSQIVASHKKEKQYNELAQRYARHFALLGEKEATGRDIMKQKMLDIEYGCDNPGCFEDDFVRNLHTLYLTYQESLLREMGHEDRYKKYVNELERRNDYHAFNEYRLASLEDIVKEIDREEDEKLATRNENKQRIKEFWKANEARVKNENIYNYLVISFDKFVYDSRLVTQAELERHFVQKMKELNFEYECDRFCDENGDLIRSRDFDRKKFYSELAKSSHGRQYRYSPSYNNYWMRSYLIQHMNSQRKLRQHQEAEARREAQRQKAAAARQTQRSHNSSFGTGFRGGFTSGGGFSGGW